MSRGALNKKGSVDDLKKEIMIISVTYSNEAALLGEARESHKRVCGTRVPHTFVSGIKANLTFTPSGSRHVGMRIYSTSTSQIL